MTRTPWPIILILIAVIAWFAPATEMRCRRPRYPAFSSAYLECGRHDETISMIFVCNGPVHSRSAYDGHYHVTSIVPEHRQSGARRDADDAELVYLIPVVMLLGIGKVSGLIAVVIYADPAMIRLTNSESGWSTRSAGGGGRLRRRRMPEAGRNVQMRWRCRRSWAGINQTIMMALAMSSSPR